jgi:hypothetical protein
MQAAAEEIKWYECGIMPGLVQSPDYIRAFMRIADSIYWPSSEAEVAERIAFREEHQRRVPAAGTPKTITVVFTEDALDHVVGDESVRADAADLPAGPGLGAEPREHPRAADRPDEGGLEMTRDTGWFKSTYSSGGSTGGSNGCVEVRFREGMVGVRDSKNAGGPALNVRKRAWRAFLVPLDK